MSRILPARLAAVALTGWLIAAGTAPLGGQIFHRPRCSRPDCAENVFREEVERMTLTEGPLAYDRDERDLREMKQRIQSELAADPADASLWLALAEAEVGLGDAIASMAAAARALEAGADSVLVQRAQGAARMRMTGGELEGATLYLDALSRMTRANSPRFLADFLPILSRDEIDWWRSIDIETRRGWAREYWEHRAALAGLSVEERIVEHTRRMAAASRLYAPPGTGSGSVGDTDVLREADLRFLPFDDRGLVYVRRGPPLREMRVSAEIFTELPTTTWLYAGVEGGIDAFHFAKSLNSGSAFRLVTAPPCDPAYVGSGFNTGVVSVSDGWVTTAAGTSQDANVSVLSCFSSDAFRRTADARINAIGMRRAAVRAMAAESPRPPFERPLTAFFDFYAFRGPDGATEVVTPIVVPVAAGAVQPIELRVTFADRGGGVVRRESTSSTTRSDVRQSIISDNEGWGVAYARTMVQPADSATFRVVLRDPGDSGRGGMWGGAMRVRSFTAYGLKISDVVVSGSGPGTWTRGSTRLFLLPARSFVPGTPAAIFYELYDLEPGSRYSTELTLTPEDESLGERVWRAVTGSGEVRFRFDSEAPTDAGSTLQELRSLVLPTEEGRYTLTVRVTDARGVVAESRRAVVISRDAAAPSGSPAEPPATDPTE